MVITSTLMSSPCNTESTSISNENLTWKWDRLCFALMLQVLKSMHVSSKILMQHAIIYISKDKKNTDFIFFKLKKFVLQIIFLYKNTKKRYKSKKTKTLVFQYLKWYMLEYWKQLLSSQLCNSEHVILPF